MNRIPMLLHRGLSVGLLVCATAAAPAATSRQAFAADSCLSGRIDDFRNDGPELAEPDVHLVPLLVTYASNGRLEFDDCVVNRYFAHTMTTCLGTDSTRLQLTIRLKAYGSQSNTDILYLGTNGQMRWGLRMNAVGSLFGAGATWNGGDTATVVLELGSLPPSDVEPSYGPRYPAGVTDVQQWVLFHGHLDIVLADDTCVDYIALEPGGTTPTLPTTWGSVKQLYR